ncbi:MAG: hypothetical protein Q4A01_00310 [Coriobacteriales bacterium]|nr:hypothetical protein [Coriobacteriales bacterium]
MRRTCRALLLAIAVLTLFVLAPTRTALATIGSARSLPNLSRSADQRGLNVFLSNFSEAGVCEGLYDREFVSLGATTQDLVNFAFTNHAQNGGAVEDVSRGKWNVRVKASKLNALLERLCGTTIQDWGDLNRTSQWFQYDKGYVYTQITNGFPLYGPAVASYITQHRKGTLKVYFDAYYYPAAQTRYSIGDGSQYSMNVSELNKLLGVRCPNRHGYAVVWANQTKDGWKYQLVSYTLTS